MSEEEIVTFALSELEDGALLSEVAAKVGFSRPTLHRWLHKTPELSDAYARAREDGLHARAERLAALAAEPMPSTVSGGIDSAAVAQLRLRVDTDKWLLSKLVPHVYGDKQHIEHSGTLSIADALREAKEKRRSET